MKGVCLRVINVLYSSQGGRDAVALQVAQQYVEAFANIAKETNTVLLPSNMSDPASMITQVGDA